MTIAPWTAPDWQHRAEMEIDGALAAAGRPRVGPVTTVKSWGRACLQTVPTDDGPVWIKYAYRLPPGEEIVLRELCQRWPDRLPAVVATWPGGVAMDPLPGRELVESDPLEDWVTAARLLGELAAGEESHATTWLELGVRDRRPAAWEPAVKSLLGSPVVRELEPRVLSAFEALVPEFITRYAEAFTAPATLVHQDSGCCNIHITDHGPVLFDWADVVVGHPVFSCDRLLDQVPAAHREAVIAAFLEPLGLSRHAFDAMRRSNVLHEVLRYHDELAYLADDDPAWASLGKSVRSQIEVLVTHELRRR